MAGKNMLIESYEYKFIFVSKTNKNLDCNKITQMLVNWY